LKVVRKANKQVTQRLKKMEILVKSRMKGRLKQAFNVSYPTITSALRYETNSDLAKKIRSAAVKHFGGVETNN
jgi:hypothetical protein